MGRLIYAGLASLDGYTVDTEGRFDWAAPDHEVHQFVNDLERGIGTYLYGRRMYEVMSFWEDVDDPEPVMQDYAAVWQAADKVVYSSTLSSVSTARTRLEPRFDAEAVRELVASAPHDVSIGGPTVAAEALRAGLVDEVHTVLNPVTVGGGTPMFPVGLRLDLELLAEHRFASGVVHLHHRVRR